MAFCRLIKLMNIKNRTFWFQVILSKNGNHNLSCRYNSHFFTWRKRTTVPHQFKLIFRFCGILMRSSTCVLQFFENACKQFGCAQNFEEQNNRTIPLAQSYCSINAFQLFQDVHSHRNRRRFSPRSFKSFGMKFFNNFQCSGRFRGSTEACISNTHISTNDLILQWCYTSKDPSEHSSIRQETLTHASLNKKAY